MRIFNKMKKAMLVLAASLFCTSAVFAETVSLTADMFKSWDSATEPTTSSAANGACVLNESTGLPYGDGNVYYLNYADLSDYTKLIVTVSEGTPRFLFNRAVDQGAYNSDESQSLLLEIPKKGEWTDRFWTSEGNVYVVNLAKIVEEKGYARLNCIKGANWANVTVTSMELVTFDLAAFDQAVADAEAFKAQLVADAIMDEETIQMANEEIDAAIVYAQEGIDEATSQEDVDIAVNMLVETVEFFKSNYEAQKVMANIQKARAAGEETLAKYPGYTDEAGLVDALMNLPMRTMGYTVEQLQAAIDAVYAAIELFEKENGPLASGNYYLKNVASGKFLVGGNSWGTFATLGEHAEDLGLTLLENGKYTIDTRLSNGGDSHYLNDGGWMDAGATGWNLIKQSTGVYALTVDGTNYIGWDGVNSAAVLNLTDPTNANAQWQVVTKEDLIAELAEATAAKPMDATFFVQDPNFGRNNTRSSAWNGGPVKGGEASNFCAERWNANFDIYQDLTGLPNGYYKVSIQGFYRAGWGGSTDLTCNTTFYAGNESVELMNIVSEAGNSAIGGNTSNVEGYGLVPNDMTSASNAFTAGLYKNKDLVVEVTDGTLRIGVKKETLIEGDWTIFDNVELAYYGEEAPAALMEGTYYMKNVASGKFLTIGMAWGTQATLGTYGFDVDVKYVGNGKYSIDTKVSNGENHWLGVDGYMDQPYADWTIVKAGDNYAIYRDTDNGQEYLVHDATTTAVLKKITEASDVNAQWQFVTRDVFEAPLAKASIANPVDATFFIQGQNFNGVMDITRYGAWQGGPTIGGRENNRCAEKWNTNFDVYQNLTNLLNGYYTVTIQGFYRAGWGGTTDMTQNAYLYAGDASTPLMSINEEAGNSAFAGGTSDVPGYGLVPNDMNCASDAFSAGLYANNRVVAQVTDGTLRIGVKKNVLIGGDWTIFDNVMLTYYGSEDPTSLFEAIDSLKTLLDEVNEWVATLDATNEMEAQVIAQVEQGLMPAAQAVLAQPTSVAQVEEMITSVSQFLLMAQTTIAQNKAMEAMQFKASYKNPVDNAGFEEAYNEIFVIANGLATGTYTWADVEAAIVKMNAARKEFIYENLPAPTVAVVAVQAGNRVVAVKNELEGVRTYYKTEADAEFKVYVAPFHISETTTVWGYSEYVDANQVVYTSDVMEQEVEAGSIIALNAPTIGIESIFAEIEEELTTDIFKTWDGTGADAQPTADAVYPEMHVGETLGAGAMVYGLSTVYYLSYADLTGYAKIVFEGTPGVQLRVLMNRLVNEGQVADGNLIEKNPVIGEDGYAVVDLTGMEFVHLNAIKTGWGSAEGTIASISLVKLEDEASEFNCVITSDQSAIINKYGITPEETITYDFFPWIESDGECAKVPSISGTLTSGEALNGLSSGLLIVKVAAYGFESAVTTKYLGASEEWEGGDAFVTDIDEVEAKEVKEIKFYTLSGVEIEEPTTGIYIQRILFTDGTVKTIKVAGK